MGGDQDDISNCRETDIQATCRPRDMSVCYRSVKAVCSITAFEPQRVDVRINP